MLRRAAVAHKLLHRRVTKYNLGLTVPWPSVIHTYSTASEQIKSPTQSVSLKPQQGELSNTFDLSLTLEQTLCSQIQPIQKTNFSHHN